MPRRPARGVVYHGAMDRKSRAALVSVASNSGLVALKLVVGAATGSVSVVSEAIHSGIDLLASALAFLAVRAASKPADLDHAYGHGKYENLSGLVEAALIFVAAGIIAFEAVSRMRNQAQAPQVDWGLVAMAVSSFVNFLVSRHLFKVAAETDSQALRADAHHLSTDIYTGLGIFVGLLLVRVTGLAVFDGLTALGVAVLIARIAWSVLRQSVGPLLDTSLPLAEVAVIERILTGFTPPLIDFHDLRTRKSGAERHVDVHLTVPANITAGEAHQIADDIEMAIARRLPNTQVITHVDVGGVDQRTGEIWRSH